MKNYVNWLLNFLANNSFYVILLFSFFAASSLIIAYIAEYVFKIMPCKLCMYSRIPFLILTFLPLIFAFPGMKSKSFYGLFIILILVLASLILAFYQLGVENHWFQASLCKFKIPDLNEQKYNKGLYDFLLGDEQKLSSCENPEFKLFGIFSFAALNLIFSVFLFILINFFIFQKFLMKFFDGR